MVFVKTLEIFGFILEICKLESFDLDIFEQIQKISIHCGFNNEKIISDPIIVKKNDGSIELFEAESSQSRLLPTIPISQNQERLTTLEWTSPFNHLKVICPGFKSRL